MRLIDADALKATFGMKNNCSECGDAWKACHYDRIYSKMDFCEWIDDAPTADAVPVVRCKDCRFATWYDAVDGVKRCFCDIHGSAGHTETDFCSYAEREEMD